MGDTDSFEPKIYAPSSVLLLLLASFSILCTLFVIISILGIGTKSEASKTVLYINISMLFAIISKFPFVYDASDNTCQFMVSFFWYWFYVVVILSALMIRATNKMLTQESLVSNDFRIYSLDNNYKYIVFIVPLIAALIPLVSKIKQTDIHWCSLDNDNKEQSTLLSLFLAIDWIIELYAVYQMILLFLYLRTLPNELLDLVKPKLLYGPLSYAAITMIVFISVDIIVIYSLVTELTPISDYYTQYALVVLLYCMGISYGVIFYIQKQYVEVNCKTHSNIV